MKYNIIILVLILIIILQRSCQTAPSASKPIVTTEIRYDTIEKEIPVYIPEWQTKVKSDTIIKIDTIEVIGDYFSTYVYTDSLINDSLKLFINDSITQNKIKSRQVNYNLIYPTTIITKEYPTIKRALYYGLEIQGNKDQINSFGPKLLYTTKNYHAYSIGLGINENMKPVLGFGIYWKFGK